MANYYCMNCGTKATSVSSLTSLSCIRHPSGKGKHQLYEGSEKSKYTCKYCGYVTQLKMMMFLPINNHIRRHLILKASG